MRFEGKNSLATDLHRSRKSEPRQNDALLSPYRYLLQVLHQACGRPAIEFSLWNGVRVGNTDGKPIASLHICNATTLFKLLIHPDLYFGEAYMSGTIVIDGDLCEFLEAIYTGHEQTPLRKTLDRITYAVLSRRSSTSQHQVRKNIYQHYDIGNHFYLKWLDREVMQYTCAYFPEVQMSLERAQIAKIHHIARKLQLQPGETVVEAGCGWGGLASYLAKHYGVRVTGYNISKEQVSFARQKAKEEGLEDLVTFVEDDYRNISGKFDVFLSVGMLEHVGPENYSALGRLMASTLKATGRGLIHTIGRNRSEPMNAWIEKRIFPGARPPSLREMMDLFEPFGFSVLDVENLRLHYRQTLQHWLNRYQAHSREIQQEFDEALVRAWHLYLAGSIAAFGGGYLQLFQVLFTHEKNNQIPQTRAHVYQPLSPAGGFHG